MKKKQTARPARVERVSKIVVRRKAGTAQLHLARAHVGQVVIQAALGVAGPKRRKREGDGASPVGVFRLEQGFFRQDRVSRPTCAQTLRRLTRAMGWSDDIASRSYNRAVPAGSPERHEKLWRDDRVYDVLITTSHNQRPRVIGGGSAIFLHIARHGYQPTEGCVAISLADMRRLLPRLGKNALLSIVG